MQVAQDQLAVIAGDKQEEGVYQLPSAVQSAAAEQYARDIARVHGTAVKTDEAEYQEFLATLGGGRGPPPPQGTATATHDKQRSTHTAQPPRRCHRCSRVQSRALPLAVVGFAVFTYGARSGANQPRGC